MWCHLISHFLILSRKPIGTALESSFFKAGTGKTGLDLILMISDQCTYTCLHHNTPSYTFISHILTFVRFPDVFMIGEWHLCHIYTSVFHVGKQTAMIKNLHTIFKSMQLPYHSSSRLMKFFYFLFQVQRVSNRYKSSPFYTTSPQPFTGPELAAGDRRDRGVS